MATKPQFPVKPFKLASSSVSEKQLLVAVRSAIANTKKTAKKNTKLIDKPKTASGSGRIKFSLKQSSLPTAKLRNASYTAKPVAGAKAASKKTAKRKA
ncbi:hypothetical protein [Lysobacter antibioticus]|uniref:hypothetical protein n=1 Tax=Lysobacter antibioticus TaxID=84531 RepID=UPI0011E011FA|nr:hypothetical protein [Lysobacter antibioticus]